MKVLGIVPARANSKRVPNKNIKLLDGKPLICHTIDVALKTKLIDKLIVSTDSIKIAEISKEAGAEVPFLRPKEFALDDTPDQPVFMHVLENLKKNNSFEPDIVLNLRPTSPFKKKSTIQKVIIEFINNSANIVRTITKVNGVHHPYWMFNMNEKKKLSYFNAKIDINNYYQSQLLPKTYRINGVVDAYSIKAIYSNKMLDSNKLFGVEISEEESFDIDTEFDFKICESLLSLNKNL